MLRSMMVLLLLRARLLMALLLLLPLLAAAAADLQSCDSAAVRLSSGHRLPALGLGVWQTPRGGATAAAVRWALAHGYRHIDTAKLYQNEDEVGEAVLGSAVPRSEVFVTSKLWVLDARCSAPSECEAWALEQVDASLARAGLEYFDLFLVHSRTSRFRAAGGPSGEGSRRPSRRESSARSGSRTGASRTCGSSWTRTRQWWHPR